MEVFVQAYLAPLQLLAPLLHHHSSYQNMRAAMKFIFVLVQNSLFFLPSHHLDSPGFYRQMPLGPLMLVAGRQVAAAN